MERVLPFRPPHSDPSYARTLEFLYALRNRGSKYGIERMRLFSDALGHPQKKFPVIHVAGTNGKGSTCAMLEALYRSNGYKTGLFVSPHLLHLGERAQVNRRIATETDIVRHTETLRLVAKRLARENADLHPTFFEFVAAMAFLRFADERVDVACVETGLGGRLDATNIVDPELSILTTVDLDHTELLGDTVEAIAREKAGIVKPGKPVLIGKLPPEAEAVVREVAKRHSSQVYSLRERFPEESTLPETNLTGTCQRWNAGAAVYATEILADRFPITSTESLSMIDWPGRWQTIRLMDKTLILDATHNAEGCRQLAENLERLAVKPVIVAGASSQKRGRHLMKTVAPFAKELYLIRSRQERAIPTEFLEACLPRDCGFPVHHTRTETIIPSPQTCRIGHANQTVVFTGSLYLIGEILERLTANSSEGLGAGLQDRV